MAEVRPVVLGARSWCRCFALLRNPVWMTEAGI